MLVEFSPAQYSSLEFVCIAHGVESFQEGENITVNSTCSHTKQVPDDTQDAVLMKALYRMYDANHILMS